MSSTVYKITTSTTPLWFPRVMTSFEERLFEHRHSEDAVADRRDSDLVYSYLRKARFENSCLEISNLLLRPKT